MKVFLLTTFVLLAAGMGISQTRSTVRFTRGTHSASAKGTITGYRYVDYVLGAQAGQNMLVELSSNNDKAQLVVLDPDNENVENGDGVDNYSGALAKSGKYKVRVLMSRAEARRKRSATSYVIKFTIQ